METMSIKTLALKALQGNPEGNREETKSFPRGKQNGNQETTKETKACGNGCAACGNKIYQAVEAWETKELPESSPWQHDHKPVTHWQCEGCGAVFKIIGGSKGPQPIN